MQAAAIIGIDGLAQLALDVLLAGGRVRPVALVVPSGESSAQAGEGLPVLRGPDALPRLLKQGVRHVIVAIADNGRRLEVAQQAEALGFALVSAIHPTASIAPSARLGRHVFVGPKAIVCVHAGVGDHCVLSTGAIVEHDNELGTGVFLAPAVRLAGGVRVGAMATIQIGSCVIPYRRIGRGALVAAGSVVIRDVADGATVRGVPARVLAPGPPRFVADRPSIVPADPVAVPAH